MKFFNSRVIAGVVSVLVITILILAGPATAFSLGIIVKEKFVKLGDQAKIFVSSQLEENEMLEVSKFELVVENDEKSFTCSFLPNGTFISGCDGFTITEASMINESTTILGYGYGYGYGYQTIKGGKLGYNISIDTRKIGAGIYNTKIVMFLKEDISEKDGGELFIIDTNGLRGCSLRANSGIVELGEQQTSRNKLSLNIPLQNAVTGSGSLQSQARKVRSKYEFRVIGTLQNNATNAQILVSGKYTENRGNSSEERAIIYLDKKNKEITISDNKVNAEKMRVTLMQRC
ncbi:MAG: hypothetical protein AABX03_04940 [Nanoarchaeota archaeon]